MLFKNTVLLGLAASVASALYNNQSNPVTATSQGTVTLAPKYTVEPVENVLTYKDCLLYTSRCV